MTAAFEKLHGGIQRYIYDNKWTELRPAQAETIEHLIGGRSDCIISAPTAGGKTEAAFLPILSMIADDASTGVRAMYVGPLKALLNDQFRRLEDLCAHIEVPVHKWHGDVGEAQRRALLTRPSGVLLITPESLEAMFVLRATKMQRIFERLAFIVIDELHSFVGSVRGAQLQSLLFRMCNRCGCDPVRIGLSATLGDPERVLTWMRPGAVPARLILDDTSRPKAIRVRGIWKRKPVPGDDEARLDADEAALRETARGIVRACRGTTTLVFANAKSQIEQLADQLRTEVESMGVADEIVVHHGSLSKELRESAEDRLRADRPCTAVCSNTLELGIDIGQVDGVVQVSAPWSVASLVQRVGRSGRRVGEASKLRAFLIEPEPAPEDGVWQAMHLDFLQGIAIIELMVTDKFIEPPVVGRPHRSTLVQQLLSILAETGGLSASALYARLAGSGAFPEVEPGEFKALLRALGEQEVIEQMSEGDLILGKVGQHVVGHYTFYAAFSTPEEFRIVHGHDTIGKLPVDSIPNEGEWVILAGKRWVVRAIDARAREVLVAPGKGRKPPKFENACTDLHKRVHEKMLELACGTNVPAYLDETGTEILARCRTTAEQLSHFCPAIRWSAANANAGVIFLWAGSKVARTLFLALTMSGFEVADLDVGLAVLKGQEGEVRRALASFAQRPPSGADLARLAEELLFARYRGADKYDYLLPDSVWREAYARDRLDIGGAVLAVQRVLA